MIAPDEKNGQESYDQSRARIAGGTYLTLGRPERRKIELYLWGAKPNRTDCKRR